jgi:hypothetical protein
LSIRTAATTAAQKQQQAQQPLQRQQQLQQLQQPQSSPPIYPNQVLPPSFPYQLQQRQQQIQSLQLPSPIAVAGASQIIVDANTNVILDGRYSYIPVLQQPQQQLQQPISRVITAYEWTQLPKGVPVNITGANTPTPTFTAPMLPYDTTLAFSLRVMSNDGMVSTNSAIVYVMVKHYTGTGGIPQQQPLQPQQPLVPSQQQLPLPPIQQQQIMPPQQQQEQPQQIMPPQQQQEQPQQSKPIYPYPYSSPP